MKRTLFVALISVIIITGIGLISWVAAPIVQDYVSITRCDERGGVWMDDVGRCVVTSQPAVPAGTTKPGLSLVHELDLPKPPVTSTVPEIPKVTSTPVIIKDKKPPQFVNLAFDGSRSLDFWNESREFAKTMTAQGKPLRFTYFISGVYFLTPKDRMRYLSPAHTTGTSAIGWGISAKDIEARINQVNLASAEGHEIGSHANGHFDGTKWTREQWDSELMQFAEFAPKMSYAGFRAPELGRNAEMFEALKTAGYRYDTSDVGKATEWPKKLKNGLWEFPLASIHYASSSSRLLSMDYNFFYKQTAAKETLTKGTPEWEAAYNDVLQSYRRYFNDNYDGKRAPISIGHHFSLWNDSLYWDAMKQFAFEVCGMEEVKCTTFSELADYLDENAK